MRSRIGGQWSFFEKVLNNKINSYLDRNGLLSPQQHTYWAGKSTQNMEDKTMTGMYLLGMSAAFNLSAKEILNLKLSQIGQSMTSD